jgi:hypothetical protein
MINKESICGKTSLWKSEQSANKFSRTPNRYHDHKYCIRASVAKTICGNLSNLRTNSVARRTAIIIINTASVHLWQKQFVEI